MCVELRGKMGICETANDQELSKILFEERFSFLALSIRALIVLHN